MDHAKVNVLSRNLLVALVVLLALAAVLVVALGGRGEPPDEVPRAVPETDRPASVDSSAATGAMEKAPVEATSRRVEIGAPGPLAAELDPSVAAALAGFTGRVVHPDGTPAAGVRVELFRVDPEVFFELSAEGSGPRLEVGHATTGEDGRFAIRKVPPSGFHLLLADAGGADPTHRVIERSPSPGEVVDLGDIVLKNGATLVGRVVDAEGGPVSGALVRALDVPATMLRMVPLERFDPEGAILVPERGGNVVLRMPPWVSRLVDRLPVATTRTAADGVFELRGVQPGRNVLVVTAPGRLPAAKAGLKLAAGERREVGEVRLREGEEVSGRVVDHDGRPVAGAEVLLGQAGLAPVVFASPAGPTDAQGRFVARGFGPGKVTGAARRGPDDTWVVGEPVPVGQEVVIELPATHTLTVRVRSGANRPLENVRFELVDGPAEMALLGLAAKREVTERAERLDGGSYRLVGLPSGKQTLIVKAAGHAPALRTLDLDRDMVEVVVELPAVAPFRVRVTDSRRRPVSGARIFVDSEGTEFGVPVPCGRTDASGSLLVDEAPAGEVVVLARHPAYGQAQRRVRLPTQEVRVVFETPGRLEGVLTEDGRPPAPGKWTILAQRDSSGAGPSLMPELPRLARPDAEGKFGIAGLRPGRYTVRAIPSLGRLRSLGSLLQSARRSWLESDNDVPVEIVSDRTVHVTIDTRRVSLDPSRPSARVAGTVTIDGVAGRGFVVIGWASAKRFVDRVGADGRFDLGRVPAGEIHVSLVPASKDEAPDAVSVLWSKSVEVVGGKDVELSIVVQTCSIAGVVLQEADGSPAAGATVHAMGRPRGGAANNANNMVVMETVADKTGRFRFSRIPAGTYQITAQHGNARTRNIVKLTTEPGADISTLELRLETTVRVSGRLDRSVFGDPQPDYVWLSLASEEGSGGDGTSGEVQPDGSFTLEDVLPGTYRVSVWATFPGGKGRDYVGEGPLVVGARGVSGVLLRVRPRPERPPRSGRKK